MINWCQVGVQTMNVTVLRTRLSKGRGDTWFASLPFSKQLMVFRSLNWILFAAIASLCRIAVQFALFYLTIASDVVPAICTASLFTHCICNVAVFQYIILNSICSTFRLWGAYSKWVPMEILKNCTFILRYPQALILIFLLLTGTKLPCWKTRRVFSSKQTIN